MTLTIAHISTVHKRTDTRIFVKELRSLSKALDARFLYLVQDGLPDEVVDGIEIRSTGPKLSRQRHRFGLGIWRMLAHVWRSGAQIVHFHDPELIPIGIILRMLGRKVIYDVHEDVPKQLFHGGIKSPILRRFLILVYLGFERIGAAMFNACIVVVPALQTRFSNSRSSLVPNFPSLNEFPAVPSVAADRVPARFIYVGGLALVRGIGEMVDAIGLVSRANATLHLHGSFPNDEIETDVARRDGWSRVTFEGWSDRAQIVSALSCASAGLVLLHPTPQYVISYPVKMFEYMAAGLPIIASDFPLWREIVMGCKCGLLVDPRDPQSIAQAMEWIIDNPDEAARMGQRGRLAVETHYNWEAESVKLVEIYRRIIGRMA